MPYTSACKLVRYRLKAKLKRPRPRHNKKRAPASTLRQTLKAAARTGLRLHAQGASSAGAAVLPGREPDRAAASNAEAANRLRHQAAADGKVNPLYKYYWLYGAVVPATGENFWLEILRLDAPCFETYLRGFAQAYPASLNVMVLDKAPAHVARSVVLHLPPYSPELNPIERLWQDLKAQIDVTSAEVRTSLKGVQRHALRYHLLLHRGGAGL